MKDIINKMLKNIESIVKIKEYNLIFKKFIIIMKNHFSFFFNNHLKSMIFILYIEFGKIFRFINSIEYFIDEKKEIMILNNYFIEISIINV